MHKPITRWVVRKGGGFIGSRHYDYSLGRSTSCVTTLEHAKLYARKGDATQSKNIERADEVVPVTVTLGNR